MFHTDSGRRGCRMAGGQRQRGSQCAECGENGGADLRGRYVSAHKHHPADGAAR
jgi:hypothetical protein